MRKWLLGGLGLLLLLCGGGVAAVTWLVTGGLSVNTVGKVAFDRPLKVPPLAPSVVDADGRRVFDLTAQPGDSDLGHGAGTRTWGYNGAYLGPTLRAQRGERVAVNVHNRLNEPTTVHWHGMHLPAKVDGGPHHPIPPGGDYQAAWTVDQPAATLWYHPHPGERTERQVYRGLAGLFLIDETEDKTGLPHDYGVDDIPVVVQDKGFSGGQLSMDDRFLSDLGVLGDEILVNGTPGPYLDVRTGLVRLRLLNASTARVYDFTMSDGRPFAMIASDGGLLAAPYTTRRVRLSVGERAEIVVAMRPGERVELRSARTGLGVVHGGKDAFDVLQLRAAGELREGALPARLATLTKLDPQRAAQRRTFTFQGRGINGDQMDMRRVDAVVVKDTVEIWNVANGHDTPHSFHIHDVQFQVLTVDGNAPPPELSGWKDTLFLEPRRRYAVIAEFADYADPTTAYMFHCHVLRHEDEGMMGQFVVVEPGDTPRLSHN
ncbi:multicopper oxidase family protein [Dactylosporangium aurantiacum]|uniref:multicopper oxidase family protein n=1 Tax=Dactylosporangium aurantiacum TaxID=35754 RepID=UPI000B20E74D|nr:multicopper oxidase domain-containing protein [Dactylosporangium aurantiacum]MDG6104723.1 multicopper oxidase domain-containing protein [Dactylosporangium aurantiacum]